MTADKADATPKIDGAGHHDTHGKPQGFWALALGAVGVVFGDIGTSPLYAMREALSHARGGGGGETAILGVVSLVLWALTLFVSIKYVTFFMRADNKGEGGTLALMALAQRAMGGRTTLIFVLGAVGAALFYADGVLTPAMSVLSAIELVKSAPGINGAAVAPYVVPISAAILIALFLVQSRGTHRMAAFFGPITALWFLVLGALGAIHIGDDLSIFRAINPLWGFRFLLENGLLGFIILGSVFLAVTGAEALYADMGHFGKKPIRAAWVWLVFPCLALNYLGQGAVVLSNPEARLNPFGAMTPEIVYWPVLILAACATVIASQAVITGAFSLTQQAVQLGLLPRMTIKRTSETQAGQIFVPAVNQYLLVGVLALLFIFQSSTAWRAPTASPSPARCLSTRFWPTWSCGASGSGTCSRPPPSAASGPDRPGLPWLQRPENPRRRLVAPGHGRGPGDHHVDLVARQSDPDGKDPSRRDPADRSGRYPQSPRAASRPWHGDLPDRRHRLHTGRPMHNLKHNKVLHEKNIILTVATAETPRVREDDRVTVELMNDDFKKVTIRYGFMEDPNVPKALAHMRKRQGVKFDIMATSFFLGRRSVSPAPTAACRCGRTACSSS